MLKSNEDHFDKEPRKELKESLLVNYSTPALQELSARSKQSAHLKEVMRTEPTMDSVRSSQLDRSCLYTAVAIIGAGLGFIGFFGALLVASEARAQLAAFRVELRHERVLELVNMNCMSLLSLSLSQTNPRNERNLIRLRLPNSILISDFSY